MKLPAHFEIYQDSRGEYRWRLRMRNGKIVADGGEGYKNRAGARRAAKRIAAIAAAAELSAANLRTARRS